MRKYNREILKAYIKMFEDGSAFYGRGEIPNFERRKKIIKELFGIELTDTMELQEILNDFMIKEDDFKV